MAESLELAKGKLTAKLKDELPKSAMAKVADPWGLIDSVGMVFGQAQPKIEDVLRRMALMGAEAGNEQIEKAIRRQKEALGKGDTAPIGVQARMNLVNTRAANWAKDHAAELVTKISDTTRASLAKVIERGIYEGWGVDELASQIAADYAFSETRSTLIAQTELAMADVAGNKLAYAASGVVTGMQWQTANEGTDSRTCEECEMNDKAVVPLGPDGEATRPYPSGAYGVPAHPNCLCDEFPVLDPITE